MTKNVTVQRLWTANRISGIRTHIHENGPDTIVQDEEQDRSLATCREGGEKNDDAEVGDYHECRNLQIEQHLVFGCLSHR